VDSGAFIPNPIFEENLHELIKRCIEKRIGTSNANDPIEAPEVSSLILLVLFALSGANACLVQDGDGLLYLEGMSTNILDLAPCTRCAGADTSHIFGSVLLDKDGHPGAETYSRNVAHRLVSETGLFRLNAEMERELENEMAMLRMKYYNLI